MTFTCVPPAGATEANVTVHENATFALTVIGHFRLLIFAGVLKM
jgi:hypothetical protein